MTREQFSELLSRGPLILDGATGSNLRAAGLPAGVSTERWVLEHPQILQKLQRKYIEAGSQVIYAPSFGANRINLANYGLENQVAELNRRLVAVSQEVCQGRALVAGDMTTTGKPADVPGGIEYGRLIEIYAEQARALIDAGVDLFAIETMMGVTECCAAIEAVRSLSGLPILCSLSLDAIGGAYFDGNAEQAAEQLPELGADAVGVNCGYGPDLLESLVRQIAEISSVPVIAKPNAGLPEMQSDGRAVYSMSSGKFAWSMRGLLRAGAKIVGGCCGTTPEHIRALAEICRPCQAAFRTELPENRKDTLS